MTNKIVIRAVYFTNDENSYEGQSFPLTEEGLKEAFAITGKSVPDAYGVYEYDKYLHWYRDFNTLKEAEEYVKKIENKFSFY